MSDETKPPGPETKASGTPATEATPPTAVDTADDDLQECWEEFAGYAKDRFDAEEKRIVEFRGWGRQLAAVVAVVVGLETGLVAQLLRFAAEDGIRSGLFAGTLLLLATMGWQLWLLFQAIRLGYVGTGVLAPEHPSVLIGVVRGCSKAKVRRIIASYYANAHHATLLQTEVIASSTGTLARQFGASLFLMLFAVVICALVILLPWKSSHGANATATPPTTVMPSPSAAASLPPSPPLTPVSPSTSIPPSPSPTIAPIPPVKSP